MFMQLANIAVPISISIIYFDLFDAYILIIQQPHEAFFYEKQTNAYKLSFFINSLIIVCIALLKYFLIMMCALCCYCSFLFFFTSTIIFFIFFILANYSLYFVFFSYFIFSFRLAFKSRLYPTQSEYFYRHAFRLRFFYVHISLYILLRFIK